MSALAVLAWVLGCDSAPASTTAAPTHRCIQTYGVDDGYDFTSDGWHDRCPAQASACTPLTAAEAEAACAAAGHDCPIALTRGGSACVAHEEGLARGVDGVVHADLIYSDTHQQAVWLVSNVLADDLQSGERLIVDATDAAVLDRYSWSTAD